METTGERPAGTTGVFRVTPDAGYSLAASIRFLEGFTPAAYEGPDAGTLRLAFVADGLDVAERSGGARVTEDGGDVVIETSGDATPDIVRDQVIRILSLDADGSGFDAVGERDPIAGALQARYPGLRPVLFHSPYEAAAWTVIGNRIRIVQAAAIKARMAAELGPTVEVHGESVPAFPGPSRVLELAAFPGLFGRKVEYLHAVAAAARDGLLEADRLRTMPVPEALTELKRIKGIGDFAAQLILLRGAGTVDAVPTHEPRLARAIQRAYRLDHTPEPAEIKHIAAKWAPYRTWVTLLLRRALEDETGEIAGQSVASPRRPA